MTNCHVLTPTSGVKLSGKINFILLVQLPHLEMRKSPIMPESHWFCHVPFLKAVTVDVVSKTSLQIENHYNCLIIFSSYDLSPTDDLSTTCYLSICDANVKCARECLVAATSTHQDNR